MIPFNKPSIVGKELEYIQDAFGNGKTCGDGKYSKLCHQFLQEKFGAPKVLLTTSGTHALEMAALLLDIQPGDEVIMPSYTFVSTVNAFVLRGAKPVFCEIREDDLNMDPDHVESLVSPKSRAIVPVHYAGIGCEMERILEIAKKSNLFVVEDAAQGVNAKYRGSFLGTIGHIGCFSFHETKNFSMGEGGAILLNDESFRERAEIIREKGTNRSKFFRGLVDKYTWVDVGSSFLPSDILAAVLWAQLEKMDSIQKKREQIFDKYMDGLGELEKQGFVRLPKIPSHISCNSHMFYFLARTGKERNELIEFLRDRKVYSVFHYIPLHESPFFQEKFGKVSLPKTENLSRRLLRLPLYYSLDLKDVEMVIQCIREYFGSMN